MRYLCTIINTKRNTMMTTTIKTIPACEAYTRLAVELDYLCRTRPSPAFTYSRIKPVTGHIQLKDHNFKLGRPSDDCNFQYLLCGCPVGYPPDEVRALRNLTRAFAQIALHTNDPQFAAVEVHNDNAEIVLGGLWSEPGVMKVSAPVRDVAEAVGRLCCIPDDDDIANYHYIGMTDTDWLAFMGIHAGTLGIPVVAEIAGYQFDLYN